MPQRTADPRESYLDSSESLGRFLARLREGPDFDECAVDTEADSMHSYETKLCLIQFAVPGDLAIIDPLALGREGLEPLLDYLRGRDRVWMHGADYDMAMFRATFDWIPERVWDTQTAARLLGVEKYGLANLLQQEYGIEVSKQSQKADWGKRPLSAKMLAYAYNDVRYLLGMGNRYVDRLREKGRFEWFEESCAAARVQADERDERSQDRVWRVSGWGKLDRKGLHYLRALWHWRDSECQRLDRPAFKFLGNRELIGMARSLQHGQEISIPKFLRPPFVRRLHKAVEEAKRVPESDYPRKHLAGNGKRLEVDEKTFLRIREIRNGIADALGIDPTLIAPRVVLERLASGNLSADEKREGLLDWQWNLLESRDVGELAGL